MKNLICTLFLISWVGGTIPALSGQTQSTIAGAAQQLNGHLPPEIRALGLKPTGRLPVDQRLNLVIGLPFRNDAERNMLFQNLYDPQSPNYHKFLSPDEFTERFGPSESDYQAIIKFARASRLTVTRTDPGRAVIDVVGTVHDIEKALHIVLLTYRHPTESRSFYAPDAEPTLDIDNKVLYIAGLNNYRLPHRASGSGPGGNFWGPDFRRAYAPDSSLTGTGQVVGLFEQEGFTSTDINAYEMLELPPLPMVSVVPILLDNAINEESAAPCGGGYPEAPMDIELTLAMAPGLDQITVYIGISADDILAEIVKPTHGEPLPLEVSSSWFNDPDALTCELAQQLAMQGQSLFQAAGDTGPDRGNATHTWIDLSQVTVVGGTVLSMEGSGQSWQSETVWPDSGGGYTNAPIPWYQPPSLVTLNGGSAQYRNFPDVSADAQPNISIVHTDPTTKPPTTGIVAVGDGTSAATPLWAAFAALANQQAEQLSQSPLGFLNPQLYRVLQSAEYASAFHDITQGTCKTSPGNMNPASFTAGTGFDNCSGLGSPAGQKLIDALVPPPTSPHCTSYGNILLCPLIPHFGPCEGGSFSCFAVCDVPCGGAAAIWTNPTFAGSDPSLDGISLAIHTETVEAARDLSDQIQVTLRLNRNLRSSREIRTSAILRSNGIEKRTDVVAISPTLIISRRESHAHQGLAVPDPARITLPFDAAVLSNSSNAHLVERTAAPDIWTQIGKQRLDRRRHRISSEVSVPGRFLVVAPRSALAN